MGVVFGDIGTSPLYAVSVTLKASSSGGTVAPEAVLGIVSLIFWSLIVVISIKYALLLMRADNHGEGGILALLALISPRRARQSRRRAVMVVIGLLGATLLYGDGAITPVHSCGHGETRMFYARKKLAQLVGRGRGIGCGPGIAVDEFMERQMPIFDTLKSIFAGAAAEPPSPPELDSTSEATLSQSLGRLSLAGPGWITMQEARRLFSPMDDHYAFGETDDQGRDNLARFAKQHDVRVDIMPTEGRTYFSRGAR